MSASTTIFRSNNNSAFYTALKNRSSAAGGVACKALYISESQSCPSTRSKVSAVSANNAGYDRKISIPLCNFGMLSKLFLRLEFNASDHVAAAGQHDACQPKRTAIVFKLLLKLLHECWPVSLYP